MLRINPLITTWASPAVLMEVFESPEFVGFTSRNPLQEDKINVQVAIENKAIVLMLLMSNRLEIKFDTKRIGLCVGGLPTTGTVLVNLRIGYFILRERYKIRSIEVNTGIVHADPLC